MLSVKNLTKIYKTNKSVDVIAIDSVTIDFPDTGMVFLLGRSGSGKSTLLNVVGGLDTPTYGEIIVKGKSSKEFSKSDFDSYRNTYVGFVFQEYNVLNEFSVEQNIAIALQLQNKPSTKEKVEEILKTVDLDGVGKRKPNTLSGGQKQRVAIARALIKDPKIIMADEPTGALDTNTGEQIFDTLKKLSKTRLVVVVSHDKNFAEKYADRIIELSDGKVISDQSRIEDEKDERNVRIIDNETLTVKDWSKITPNEIEQIVSILKKNGKETIITQSQVKLPQIKNALNITEESVGAFSKTDKANKKDYSKEKVEFIKSRLPLRHALKMASEGIKTKPIRLIFTVLLAVIAFVFFGISSTLALYNPAYSVSVALENSYYDSIVLQKNYTAYYQSIELSRDGTETIIQKNNRQLRTAFTKEDLENLNNNQYGLKFVGLIDLGVYKTNLDSVEGYSNLGLALSDLRINYPYNNYYSITAFSGVSDCGHNFLLDNGFELVCGEYPQKENEIAITEYIYNAYKCGGPVGDMGDYDFPTPNDILGKTINVTGIPLIITAVYDVGEIPSKYDELLNDDTQLDNIGLKALKEEFHDVIFNSFHTVGFVSEEFYSAHRLDRVSINNRDVFGLIFSSMPITNTVAEDRESNVYTEKTLWQYDEVVDFFDLEFNLCDLDEGDDYVYLPYNYIYEKINNYFIYIKEQGLENNPEYKDFVDAVTKYQDHTIETEDYIYLAKTVLADYENLTGNQIELPKTIHFKNLKNESGQLEVKGFYLFTEGTNGNYYNYFVPDSVCDKYEGQKKSNSGGNTYSVIYSTDYVLDAEKEKYGNVISLSDHSYEKTNFMLGAGDNGAKYTMRNAIYAITAETAKMLYEMKLVFYISSGIFGVFAGLMLFNFISASISSKRKEIGILRAVGARSADVFKIFIIEALALTLTCFLISCLLSYFACAYLNVFMLGNAVRISILNYGIANIILTLLIVVIVSIVATIIPVLKASEKSPVESIRAL